MIADAFRRPTWAFSSRPVSLVASGVLWFVPRDIPRRVSSVDEFEALVLGEVGVVLDVERGEGKLAGDAAGGDPGVVDRSRATAEPGVGLDLAPTGGGLEAAGQDDDAAKKARRPARRGPPAVQVGPLGELADGDEGDRELLAGEVAGEGIGQLALEDRRGDVGVATT